MSDQEGSAGAGSDTDRLNRRYGTPRRTSATGRGAWIGGGIVAVVIAIVVAWMTFAAPTPPATVTAASYTVLSEHEVSVTFAVERADPGLAVRCSVEALDASHAQVGARDVRVPAGSERSTTVTVSVVTFARAESAHAMEGSCIAD